MLWGGTDGCGRNNSSFTSPTLIVRRIKTRLCKYGVVGVRVGWCVYVHINLKEDE